MVAKSKTKNKKQTENKKKENTQIADYSISGKKIWRKPNVNEWYPDWYRIYSRGEEEPLRELFPIESWAKGGIAKKKTKKKKPRGVGIASRGYGKAMR